MDNEVKKSAGAAEALAQADAQVRKTGAIFEGVAAEGHYDIECRSVIPGEGNIEKFLDLQEQIFAARANGEPSDLLEAQSYALTELKWKDEIENLVVTSGKNLALDTLFAGSGYTVTGPFMGLADSAVASAVLADTLAAKTLWKEVGGANAPSYTGTRKTVTFSAAAAGAKSSTGTYTFTFGSGGTVGGCFIVTGAGAVSTLDSTAGVLYSVGAFTGGTKTVAATDTLTVTYSASM